MSQAMIGIVSTRTDIESIVDRLRSAGFTAEDISLLMGDETAGGELAVEVHSKAPEGAAAGVATGAVLGGALGWLDGIGSLTIPGLGWLVAAGPIMAALSAAAAVGGIGGIAGALIGLGIPELEAKQYEARVRQGHILISIRTERPEEDKLVEEVLSINGATEIRKVGQHPIRDQRKTA